MYVKLNMKCADLSMLQALYNARNIFINKITYSDVFEEAFIKYGLILFQPSVAGSTFITLILFSMIIPFIIIMVMLIIMGT